MNDSIDKSRRRGLESEEMSSRLYIALFLVSALVLLGVAWLESSPGYMDADYYYASGLRIAIDNSWTEPFIWNFLADPQTLPQPAFTYWMPLTGIISAVGMNLTGSGDFWSARIFFLLTAASLAPLTAFMAVSFTPKKWAGLLAGGLGIFSGYYLVHLPTTETFAVFILLGGLSLLIIRQFHQDIEKLKDGAGAGNRDNLALLRSLSPAWLYLAAGFAAALMFMTRVDGLVWLVILAGAIVLQFRTFIKGKPDHGYSLASSGYWLPILLYTGGFLLISSPWIVRNFRSFGTLFAPGSASALWLTSYDDLFAFPASQLSFENWISQGIGPILSARAWALGLNGASTLAVQGGIFLLPLILSGMWVWRQDWRVSLSAAGWALILLMMTLVFPFQGARGGFFHAGAAFQSLFWGLVPAGLAAFVSWGQRKRGWSGDTAAVRFSAGIIIGVFLITGFLAWQRLSGASDVAGPWSAKSEAYAQVEAYLMKQGALPDQVVMVNNPPGYYAVTGRQAIVIPHGGLQAAQSAADKFEVSYLVVDENFAQGLDALYQEPGDYPQLRYLGSSASMQVYRLEP